MLWYDFCISELNNNVAAGFMSLGIRIGFVCLWNSNKFVLLIFVVEAVLQKVA